MLAVLAFVSLKETTFRGITNACIEGAPGRSFLLIWRGKFNLNKKLGYIGGRQPFKLEGCIDYSRVGLGPVLKILQ